MWHAVCLSSVAFPAWTDHTHTRTQQTYGRSRIWVVHVINWSWVPVGCRELTRRPKQSSESTVAFCLVVWTSASRFTQGHPKSPAGDTEPICKSSRNSASFHLRLKLNAKLMTCSRFTGNQPAPSAKAVLGRDELAAGLHTRRTLRDRHAWCNCEDGFPACVS